MLSCYVITLLAVLRFLGLCGITIWMITFFLLLLLLVSVVVAIFIYLTRDERFLAPSRA